MQATDSSETFMTFYEILRPRNPGEHLQGRVWWLRIREWVSQGNGLLATRSLYSRGIFLRYPLVRKLQHVLPFISLLTVSWMRKIIAGCSRISCCTIYAVQQDTQCGLDEWVCSALVLARHVSDLIGPSSGAFCRSCFRRLWYVL